MWGVCRPQSSRERKEKACWADGETGARLKITLSGLGHQKLLECKQEGGEGEDVIPQTWEHLLHLLDDPVAGHEAPQAMSLRGTVRALKASSQDGFIGSDLLGIINILCDKKVKVGHELQGRDHALLVLCLQHRVQHSQAFSSWMLSILSSLWPCNPPSPCSLLYILGFFSMQEWPCFCLQDNMSALQTHFSLPPKMTVMVVIGPQILPDLLVVSQSASWW